MITFAAIRTTYVPADDTHGAGIVAYDGNDARRVFVPFNPSLGLVDAHRVGLVAFLGDQAQYQDRYVVGYLDDGYVWVRPDGSLTGEHRNCWRLGAPVPAF